jgi:hypothetical protein
VIEAPIAEVLDKQISHKAQEKNIRDKENEPGLNAKSLMPNTSTNVF